MSNTKKKKTVLIIGDLAGITNEIALRYSMEGGQPVVIDTGVGSDEDHLAYVCKALNISAPLIIKSGSISPDRTREILTAVKENYSSIDALVFAHTDHTQVNSFAEYDEEILLRSVEQNSWPIIDYTRQIRDLFGCYPKYVVGIAPSHLDTYTEGYDFTAVTKSLNEVFVKYLSYHLFDENVVFNMIRTIPTGSEPYRKEVAKALFAMTSGFMDAISGQTIVMDGGESFYSHPRKI